MDRSALSYWESFVTGRVSRIPPPVAPSPEDIAFIERQVSIAAEAWNGVPVEALLLGVTRPLASMNWPPGTSLVSVDWAAAMIRNLWAAPGGVAFARAVRADWRELPLADASRNIVLGDGCYAAVGTIDDVRLLNREVHRVLKRGGLYCLRCFARPAPAATVEDCFRDLEAARFPNFFLFRWLLAMAVHGDSREGVVLDDVWREWKAGAPDPGAAFVRCGWPADAAWGIERWRGVQARFYFPSPSELREFAEPLFDLLEYRVPSYQWGECFPSLLMRARG